MIRQKVHQLLGTRKRVGSLHWCVFYCNLPDTLFIAGWQRSRSLDSGVSHFISNGEIWETGQDWRGILRCGFQMQTQRHWPDSGHQEVCGVRRWPCHKKDSTERNTHAKAAEAREPRQPSGSLQEEEEATPGLWVLWANRPQWAGQASARGSRGPAEKHSVANSAGGQLLS